MAGYSYTFYAIPKRKAQVAKVDPKVCEKLEALGWFDQPYDGPPSHGGAPHHGSPSDGEARSKGKDKNKVKDKNKGITPSPLSGKEGNAAAFSREDTHSSTAPEVEVSVEVDPEDVFRPGRWFRTLDETAVGSRFLKMLSPQQIPGDKALRTFSRMVDKGEITHAYLTFVWEKVILPNRRSAESEGAMLKSLPEILETMKKEAYSATQESFKLWARSETEKLRELWKEAHKQFHQESFNEKVAELAAFNVEDGVHFFPESLEPDHYCTPLRLLLYYKRCSMNDALGYRLEDLISAFHKDSVWGQLLNRATISLSNFVALEHLVLTPEIASKIPQTREHDVRDLRNNYSEQHWKKITELEGKFADMGTKPPATQQVV
ncbi:hypothetical protein VSU19_22510 [Verrucomicrobiales bacterium BCK34]|nr:hypothetical protein [Verrucomicrobiales bacterium BCK34]